MANNPTGTLEAINALCDEVSTRFEDAVPLRWHAKDCYVYHTDCLVARIQDIQTGMA